MSCVAQTRVDRGTRNGRQRQGSATKQRVALWTCTWVDQLQLQPTGGHNQTHSFVLLNLANNSLLPPAASWSCVCLAFLFSLGNRQQPTAETNDHPQKLCGYDNIQEAAVLSTCNRFEVYIAATDAHAAIRDVMTHLQEYSGLSQSELRQNLFMLSREDAVWHLLRVSAGLDSLVVGEGQILSQVSSTF